MAYWLLLLAQSAAISLRQPVNCVMPMVGGGSDLMWGYRKSSLYTCASFFSKRLVQNFYDIASSTFLPFSPSGPSHILQLPWLSWALPSAGWQVFSEVLHAAVMLGGGPWTRFTLVLFCPVLQVYVCKYLPENLVGFSYRIWLPPQSSSGVSLILCWIWSFELLSLLLRDNCYNGFLSMATYCWEPNHHEVILRTKLQTLETCVGQAHG